jgi:hypothetical protein
LGNVIAAFELKPYVDNDKIEDMKRRIGYGDKSIIDSNPFTRTPDFVYIRNKVKGGIPELVIGDFGISLQPDTTKTAKISKYRNFEIPFISEKIRVRFDIVIVEQSLAAAREWARSLNIPAQAVSDFLRFFQRFFRIREEVLSQHEQRELIIAFINDEEVPKTEFFEATPINMKNMIASGFWRNLFYSSSDAEDMFKKTGKFKDYFGSMNAGDESVIDEVCDYLKMEFAVIDRMDESALKMVVMSDYKVHLGANMLEERLMIPVGDAKRKVLKNSSKIIPVPYFELNMVEKKKEAAFKVLSRGIFSSTHKSSICLLLRAIANAEFMEFEEVLFINGARDFKGSTEKERLKYARDFNAELYLEAHGKEVHKGRGIMVSNRRTIRLSKYGDIGDIYNKICIEVPCMLVSFFLSSSFEVLRSIDE